MSTGWRSAHYHNHRTTKWSRRTQLPCQGVVDERSGGWTKTACTRGRYGNGGWLRSSLCARPTHRWTCNCDRPQGLGISHPKLHEVLHQDFAAIAPTLAPALSDQDAAVFCLGAYTGAVTDVQLRAITVGYTIEFARVSARVVPTQRSRS